jgi:hypothetical protein
MRGIHGTRVTLGTLEIHGNLRTIESTENLGLKAVLLIFGLLVLWVCLDTL